MKHCKHISANATLQALTARSAPKEGTLLDTALRLHAGDVSPLELVQECFERIPGATSVLNCFVTLGREQAEESAKSLLSEKLHERPLLWGIPISVKDLTPTRGLRTTFSSKAFADYVPEKDAPIVAAMRAAGMIVVGKTNTPEFGILPVTESELNGICRNPWALDRSVGGSSGGAAASVAAGLTAVAHGTDGAGSLRIPASCCGVFAVVLPHGRLPPAERVVLGRGAQDGVFSRTVADAVYYLAGMKALTNEELACAMAEPAPSSASDSIVLTCTPPIACEVAHPCLAATYKAAELLAEVGHRIVERSLNWSSDSILEDMRLVRSTIPVAYGDPEVKLLDCTTRFALMIGAKASAFELYRTMARISSYAEMIMRQLDQQEILLTPTLARPSVPHGWITEPVDPAEVFRRSAEFSPFTAFVNITGMCAVSVPLGSTDDGIPVGVQLASRPSNLARILRLAAELERLAPWNERKPHHFYT